MSDEKELCSAFNKWARSRADLLERVAESLRFEAGCVERNGPIYLDYGVRNTLQQIEPYLGGEAKHSRLIQAILLHLDNKVVKSTTEISTHPEHKKYGLIVKHKRSGYTEECFKYKTHHENFKECADRLRERIGTEAPDVSKLW